MCIILELILVSLHEGHLPSGWDIVVEHQCNKGPSDWENNYVPYYKASLYPGSLNVYFTITGDKDVIHSTLSLLSSHVQYCHILKDSKDHHTNLTYPLMP